MHTLQRSRYPRKVRTLAIHTTLLYCPNTAKFTMNYYDRQAFVLKVAELSMVDWELRDISYGNIALYLT